MEEEASDVEVTEEPAENNESLSSSEEIENTEEELIDEGLSALEELENIEKSIDEGTSEEESASPKEESEDIEEELIDEGLSALEELENIEESIDEGTSEEESEDIEEELIDEGLSALEELENIEKSIDEGTAEEEYVKDSDASEINNELSLDKYTLIELEDGTKIKRTSYAKDNIDVDDSKFSDEQNYVVQHIYTEEQDTLMKEVSEKDALTEEELEDIDCVEEFDLNTFFNNQKINSNNNDEIEVPDLYDDIS
ncbi:hypothetical protein, partial [Brachyspira hampsonii]|uniref:hypothetical protein n=1 Tax=Brachyspira hampsonii TaxID=1287055 RepID=UPI0019D2C034